MNNSLNQSRLNTNFSESSINDQSVGEEIIKHVHHWRSAPGELQRYRRRKKGLVLTMCMSDRVDHKHAQARRMEKATYILYRKIIHRSGLFAVR